MKDCILEDLQPIRLGLNGRAIMVKFGKFEQKVYGYTKSDLYIKCIVDQLRRDPYNHIHKIKFRRTKYAGQEEKDFGNHYEIEFLSEQNYILGHFENVEGQKMVENQWVQDKGWK